MEEMEMEERKKERKRTERPVRVILAVAAIRVPICSYTPTDARSVRRTQSISDQALLELLRGSIGSFNQIFTGNCCVDCRTVYIVATRLSSLLNKIVHSEII